MNYGLRIDNPGEDLRTVTCLEMAFLIHPEGRLSNRKGLSVLEKVTSIVGSWKRSTVVKYRISGMKDTINILAICWTSVTSGILCKIKL